MESIWKVYFVFVLKYIWIVFCPSLKVAYYLALNVDIIEVFVLAKPSWRILYHKSPIFVPTLLFSRNMKAKMKIFIAHSFLECCSALSELRDSLVLMSRANLLNRFSFGYNFKFRLKT